MADPEIELPVPTPADRTRQVVVWAAIAVLSSLLASTAVAGASYRAVLGADAARQNTDRQLGDALGRLNAVQGTVDINNDQALCRSRIAAALDLADRQADRVWRRAIADKVLRGVNVDAVAAANEVATADRLVDELGDLRIEADRVCQANPGFQPPDKPSK